MNSDALYLCRFAHDDDAHLGLVREGTLSDLTATGRPQFASLSRWLIYAAGRAAQAIEELASLVGTLPPGTPVDEVRLLAPIDTQEVWACGVTYTMSREARMRESGEPTVYERVYDAPRPEVFFKATPHRVVGIDDAVGVRGDSTWDVPEPELTLLVTPGLEIVGYTVGNDMSSRSIEGENPLYLPQAKVYARCCALGPWVRLATPGFDPLQLAVRCAIHRGGAPAFQGETSTAQIHRPLDEMVSYLGRCNQLPDGAYLMTGTGVVPPDTFTLQAEDLVEITIEGIGTLRNTVVLLEV